MNKKHIMWIIPSGVLILGLFIYNIRKPSDKESEEQEKAHRVLQDLVNRPVTEASQHNERPKPYNEKLALYGSVELIEKRAKIVIKDYQYLSSEAKKHLYAQMLVVSFLSCSDKIMGRFRMLNEPDQKKPIESLYSAFINSEKKVSTEFIEQDYKKYAELQCSKCPIYRLFFQMNNIYPTPYFACNVGVNAVFEHDSYGDTFWMFKAPECVHMLDIKKTIKNRSIGVSLKEYLGNFKFPLPEKYTKFYRSSTPVGSINNILDAMIFYSDLTESPSVYMPGSVDFKKYADSDKLYTYNLKSVIIADGNKDDVYNMKVLHRPAGNIEEFVKIANQKGYYFFYEME
ncbi:hypothetical protein ENBRE01_0347 [Enteropsectra breve]|nr:hypothetical protein ENBRE01_0347 [Enteropsectra breve]